MTNYVLGRRSSLLAGGVPQGGMFDFTQPRPALPIDPMMVIVTWGGSNDTYGGSIGGATVARGSVVEEAAIASQFWEKQPGTHQIACRGADMGHRWITGLNDWIREALVAHPKGSANAAGWTMPPVPPGTGLCSEEPASYQPQLNVACSASGTAGCQAYCQMLGNCVVENGTLGMSMLEQTTAIGFGGGTMCGGCVSACEQDAAGSTADAAVLGCLAGAAPATTCGPGLAGGDAFITIDKCCDSQPGSKVCSRFCGTYKKSFWYAAFNACR
jgi:hypothetical protein